MSDQPLLTYLEKKTSVKNPSDLTDKQRLVKYFDAIASQRERWRNRGGYYHRELERYLRFFIPPGASVLEIGCGLGDTLAALKPTRGVGVDISPKMIEEARRKYPDLEFCVDDLDDLQIEGKFDYVVLSGLLGHLEDIQTALGNLHKVCNPQTRVAIVYYNYLWEPIMKASESLGLKMRQFIQHWLPLQEIENLLYLNDFEVIRKRYQLLLPVYLPLISRFFNRILANLPLFWKLSLNEIVIARSRPPQRNPEDYTCSVVVPCRNERGNIETIVKRLPNMGRHTELIFVEGHSTDGTLDEIRRVVKMNPEKDIKVFVQGGKGKADAVWKGFDRATGDVLMILDADITVPPEDLPKFFIALIQGKGEFINGTRLVYQMDEGAMRFLNTLGNKFFSRAFTYLLEQPFRDTLCGTKVLFKVDYERIVRNRSYFGDFDPFGDFDLIFGAAKLNLKIVEIPIRYRSRSYGTTQINRFQHGWLLLKMTFLAMRRIKFI